MPHKEPYWGLPNYDPGYCLKVARWSAAGCLAVLAVEVLILLIVDPSASRCPGWMVQSQERSDSLWLMVLLVTGPLTAWMCFVTLRWNQGFSAMIHDRILHPKSMFGFGNTVEQKAQSLLLDFNQLFLMVCASWTLASALPLGFMLCECADLSGYLR